MRKTCLACLVDADLATRGLLIRGGDVLEAAAAVDTNVFDKTGTLTEGRPSVSAVVPSLPARVDAHRLLALAASLEQSSTHPLANAVTNAAATAGWPFPCRTP